MSVIIIVNSRDVSMKKIYWSLIISLIIPAFAVAAIRDVRVSNNTSAGVTISWVTDSDTTGEVHYSEFPDLSGALVACDTRGQAFVGCTHYVDIANLKKEKTYYFEVVSGVVVDNNNGSYYTCKTMKEPYAPPGTCLYYGYVYQEDGATAAEGAIVHLWLTRDGVDSYPLSKLIGPQGSFLFTVKEARSIETDDLFSSIHEGDPIYLETVYCGNYAANKNVLFEGCTYNCGSMVLSYSQSTSTTPVTSTSTTPVTSTSTTTAITIPTTTPTTAPIPAPTTTPTTIPLVPETTSTSTQASTSTTTTKPSTTTTKIPLPDEYRVEINPSSLDVVPWKTLEFSARTYCNGEELIGTYRWYLSSTVGSSIDENGVYKAGPAAGTDVVTVIDIAHGNSLARTEVNIALLWPMAYDKMWGERKGENLSLLRAFRDEVLSESEIGREYIFMLYNNSLEILILLITNPSLTEETKEVIDELLPGIQSLLEGRKTSKKKKAVIDTLLLGKQSLRKSKKISPSEAKIAHMESLLNHLEKKAVSRRLKKALKKARGDLRKEGIFTSFGITGYKPLVGNRLAQ